MTNGRPFLNCAPSSKGDPSSRAQFENNILKKNIQLYDRGYPPYIWAQFDSDWNERKNIKRLSSIYARGNKVHAPFDFFTTNFFTIIQTSGAVDTDALHLFFSRVI
jgi:hypothetical protein